MSYTKADLEKKLIEIYPEIRKYGLSLALEFDEGKNAWVVTFKKGDHQRHAYLDKGDADSCMEGNACIYLGVLIIQYIKDLEEEIAADK
ncbi:MAG: hypothetical protein ACOWYE_07105 [Desulfatiglandales bacterium]